MIFRRKRPIHYDGLLPDGRTMVVVDRLERVAEKMEQLATEMETRLRLRASIQKGDDELAGGS